MCLPDLPKHTSPLPLTFSLPHPQFHAVPQTFQEHPSLTAFGNCHPKILGHSAQPTPSLLTASIFAVTFLMRPPSWLYFLFLSIAPIIFSCTVIRAPTQPNLPGTSLVSAPRVPHPGDPLSPEQTRTLVNLTTIYYFCFLSLLVIFKVTFTRAGIWDCCVPREQCWHIITVRQTELSQQPSPP